MNNDAGVEQFFRRKFDIKNGRWDTAIRCSIVYGMAIVTINLSLSIFEHYFYKYTGVPVTDAKDTIGSDVTRISFLLMAIVIAPVLESVGVIFIHFILTEPFRLPGVVFIVITTVVFGWLHKHPFNGGVIFLLLSIQYLFMRMHYRKAVAFWSIAISHAVNNAVIVPMVLISTAFS